jgi:hypothetical protein
MKIAQIAPLIESVPPRLYGGAERIVSYLTEELVAHSCPAASRRWGSIRPCAILFPTA